jgi:hypothetical protein
VECDRLLSVDSRLDRFRTYFERLAPASKPGELSDDLYAEPPGRATGQQLASRLQLAPSSSHLLTGVAGTGKTTQLYQALKALRSTGDTHAVYVDVSRQHDLDQDLEGVLIVLAGLELAKVVGKHKDDEVEAARENFRRWAYGYREFVEYELDDNMYDHDGEPGYWRDHPGVIAPPVSPLSLGTREKIKALKTLKKALPDGIRHFVILFDSLDRLDDVEAFRKAVIEDVRALQQAGIGLAIVGPIGLLYGQSRPIVDIFEQVHVIPAFDVERDAAAHDFLIRVLAKRTDASVLGPEMREKLAHSSGGLLRDLLQLTRDAVEEAFVTGADAVTPEHVERAVDKFGRTMMFGLRKWELKTLDELQWLGAFVPTSDDDIALLVSRRVIEYQGSTKRYAVHPAIEPLLVSLREKI